MKYAFLNADCVVVNVIAGVLSEQQLQLFLSDYGALFGSVYALELPDDTSVYIGGRYDSAEGFLPPEPPAETIVDDAI